MPRSTTAPPRVAYVMSRFPKLTETFVLYEMLALEATGVAVEIFPLLRHRTSVRHPEADRLVERARFAPFLSPRVLVANLAMLRRDPGRYLRVWWEVLSGTWGSANFFLGALGILPKSVFFAREMEKLGVQHVHAHFANHPAVAALIVHRLTGIPWSFTAHGSDLHVERRMLEAKVRAAAFVVTVSGYNRELIAAECGDDVRSRVHVVHCGVDAERFATRRTPRDDGRFRVTCVASLEPVKGHRFLVEACRLLRDRGVRFECELIGDGPLRRDIEARVRRARLDRCIWIRGRLPRPDVIRALRDTDAAVQASHPTPAGKREGIPVALMEAMASEVPVVASAVSGIPELVENGRTGILVPPGDPAALADALERLAGDARLRRRLGRAARAKVRREFDLHRSARRILDLVAAAGGFRTDRGGSPRGRPRPAAGVRPSLPEAGPARACREPATSDHVHDAEPSTIRRHGSGRGRTEHRGEIRSRRSFRPDE